MSYVGKVTAGGSTHLVGSTLYGTCDTAASTTAKVVTCANFDKLETGVTIHVKFDNTNTASAPTLNVNSTGAKRIYWQAATGAPSGVDYWWQASSVVSFTYDGNYWLMNDVTGTRKVDTTIASGSTSVNVPTTAAVASFVESQMGDVAGALVYKGTVSAGSELLNTALKKGWYYIVDTAGSYAGTTCEPGDMIIVHTAGTYTAESPNPYSPTGSTLADAVDIIQTNIDTITNSDIDTIVAS